jgi:hypothetical protein
VATGVMPGPRSPKGSGGSETAARRNAALLSSIGCGGCNAEAGDGEREARVVEIEAEVSGGIWRLGLIAR